MKKDKLKKKLKKWEREYEIFLNKYKTEEECQDRLKKNWEKNYICPMKGCPGDEYYGPYKRGKTHIYECTKCGHQSSITSGIDIFKNTRTKLTVWFKMIFLITQRGKYISTMELLRRVGYRKKKYKTIHEIRKRIENKLHKSSAKKIFKGIVRKEDIEIYRESVK